MPGKNVLGMQCVVIMDLGKQSISGLFAGKLTPGGHSKHFRSVLQFHLWTPNKPAFFWLGELGSNFVSKSYFIKLAFSVRLSFFQSVSRCYHQDFNAFVNSNFSLFQVWVSLAPYSNMLLWKIYRTLFFLSKLSNTHVIILPYRLTSFNVGHRFWYVRSLFN